MAEPGGPSTLNKLSPKERANVQKWEKKALGVSDDETNRTKMTKGELVGQYETDVRRKKVTEKIDAREAEQLKQERLQTIYNDIRNIHQSDFYKNWQDAKYKFKNAEAMKVTAEELDDFLETMQGEALALFPTDDPRLQEIKEHVEQIHEEVKTAAYPET